MIVVAVTGLLFKLIDNKWHVCLGQRGQKCRTSRGSYAPPSGHLEETDSSPYKGLQREISEETGLNIEESQMGVLYVLDKVYEYANGTKHCIHLVCPIILTESQVPINAEPDHCEGWEFFPIGQLPSPIWPSAVDAINFIQAKGIL